ncbi:MAG: hypothetical protein KDB02_05835 [Acidimicrobiales bacterium]|nr:hypothetical protein [Acidimicrobiales bacterium]
MRIEQLVLYGPGEDERVRFGSGVTVFSGLSEVERQDLIRTLVDALTGRLPNASIVYLDAQGRKVYADRTGATYAHDGSRAPSPHEVLGQDPVAVSRLLTCTGSDLGIGSAVPAEEIRAALDDARQQLERRGEELAELEDRAAAVAELRHQLATLTERIASYDDDAARWAWVQQRKRLDELRADLNLAEQPDRERTDRRILDAVEALRSAGEAWAGLAANAAELRSGLGPLPAVSQADLDRVAGTPADLPADFEKRYEAWKAANELHVAAAAELDLVSQPPHEPEDPLVGAFAAIDQGRLWSVHHELEAANDAYAALSGSSDHPAAAAEAEDAIEAAHVEVVRCRREVERLQLAGLLGTAVTATLGLLLLQAVSPLLGLLAFVAATVIMAVTVVVPRRRLGAAELVEEQALRQADADSWLGLHLRRLADLTDGAERKRFEGVAKRRAAAQVAWDEIAGAVTPDDLTARADAVRSHAEALDPKVRARRIEEVRTFCDAAAKAEDAARAALTGGLEPYGFTPASGAALDPAELATQLRRRIRAGEVARKAKRLAQMEQREVEASRNLDELLKRLGFTDGSIESRLERAIGAVASARDRGTDEERDPAQLRHEIEKIVDHLRATVRPSWSGSPDPTAAPTDPAMLDARRREIAELVAAAGSVDVPAARQRIEVAKTTVAELEQRLNGLGASAGSIEHRLTARLGRTTHLQDHEESVPVFVDDALREVPAVQRLDLLDQLERASAATQVVILSDDDVVARWARDRSGRAAVTLYETGPEPALPAAAPPGDLLDLDPVVTDVRTPDRTLS